MMKTIRLLANRNPILFGLAVTLVFILGLIISAVMGSLWPGASIYGQPGGIAGRVIVIAALLAVLGGLGWLRSAGFTALGSWWSWLWPLAPLAYVIFATTFAMSGRLKFDFPNPALSGLVCLFILVSAFLEEVTFRGLILRGLLSSWGSRKGGLLAGILISSLMFCSIHLLDFLGGRPLLNVFLQSLEAFFLGIFLATLVVISKSIYPAVIFHFVVNLAGFLSFAALSVEPAPVAWLIFSLMILPLALLGLILLRGLPQPADVDPAVGYEI